jgi:predicted SprT family Zn-dependent metalloprotease
MANMTIKQYDAIAKLRAEAKRLFEKYDVPAIKVEFNNRLRTTAGRIYYYTRIELASKYLEEFGYERVLSTLRHEIAHHVSFTKYGQRGHTTIFKELCSEMEGSMNQKMAGITYAHCATDQYTNNLKKYLYKCKCGVVHSRTKKPSADVAARAYCRTCGTKVKDMTLSINY